MDNTGSAKLFKEKIEAKYLGAVYLGYCFGKVGYMKDGEVHTVDAISLLME